MDNEPKDTKPGWRKSQRCVATTLGAILGFIVYAYISRYLTCPIFGCPMREAGFVGIFVAVVFGIFVWRWTGPNRRRVRVLRQFFQLLATIVGGGIIGFITVSLFWAFIPNRFYWEAGSQSVGDLILWIVTIASARRILVWTDKKLMWSIE